MPIPIDFSNIRGDTIEGKRVFFEQLVCKLAELDGSGGEYRRIEGAGGDGGVEALRILPSGRKIGYQAKYYLSRDDIDWSKLDNSVKTALKLHQELERYVIALPCDFTGKRATRGGSTEGIWGKWDGRVKRWNVQATSLGMKVEFEPWTAFNIETALLQPHEEKIAILLSMSCVPGHKWNADFISERLMSLLLADRDSVWSRWFTNDRSALVDRAEEVVDWALNVDAKTADAEVVRLAGITLTWLFTVTNRPIRDRATKGLVNLLVGVPALFPELIKRFCGVDDPYVLDRLLAAGYGAICIDPTNQRIAASAKAVADSIFGRTEPPIHLTIRAWSISFLQCATERGLCPAKFDMARLQPPFCSAPPVFDITERDLEKIAEVAGDVTIARSCQLMGDFFTDVVSGAIGDFSETPLTEPPPLTQDERANCFEANVRALDGYTVERLDDLLRAVESCRKEELPLITFNLPHDPYRRQIQAFVSLVLYRENDRQKVVDGFLSDHGRGW